MAISLEHAYLVSIVLAALFYGIFFTLYVSIIYVIFFLRASPHSKKSPAMIIVTLMLIVATVHLGVSFIRAKAALIDKIEQPGGALAYLNHTSAASYMLQDTLYGLQTLMGDSFIVYRLYIVYGKDKRVLIPTGIMLLGGLAVTAGSLVFEGKAKPGSSIFSLKAWIQSFITVTLATNLPCTILVAYKLWSVERQLYRVKKNRYLTKVAVTIVESGALYSAFLVAFLVTYITGDWSLYLPFLLLPQIIGVAFSLVMVRIGLGISTGDTSIITLPTISVASQCQMREHMQESSPGMTQVTRLIASEDRHCDPGTSAKSARSTQKVSKVQFDTSQGTQSCTSTVEMDDPRDIS